jgi:transcriptional regulator with GAF, ATPase, and Fis domain
VAQIAGAREAAFPSRYEPVAELGTGGGGVVWAAKDRLTGQVVALKLLHEKASEPEMLALVREATALSGIEGLGVPRVLDFGRLPKSGRAYMVRELAPGRSLADLLDARGPAEPILSAIVQAGDLLTRLHRSLLLHGDIKPANIIVAEDGTATLVDLGLAAPWLEGGAKPEGLTPRYAAPELFYGAPLTPRAEVFALGATLGEVVRVVGGALEPGARVEVDRVVERATREQPDDRFPSVDELVQALCRAARLEPSRAVRGARVWSIVGIDRASGELLARARGLARSGGLVLVGRRGSGRSTMLRRLSWSLGVAGVAAALIEPPARTADVPLATALDLALAGREPGDVTLLVDDADRRSGPDLERLDALRRRGAALVMVVSSPAEATALPGATFALFELPPLEARDAQALVRRMIPSLSDRLVEHVVTRTGGLPGPLRALVEQLEGKAVVSIEDIDQGLDRVPLPPGVRIELGEIHRLLDRGRFDQAADYLEAYRGDDSIHVALARAKLWTGRGEPTGALRELARVEPARAGADVETNAAWHLQRARAHLRAGDNDEAELHANFALAKLSAPGLDHAVAAPRGRPAGTGSAPPSAAAEPPASPHGPVSSATRVAVARATGKSAATPEAAAADVDRLGPLVADALAVRGIAQSWSARHEEAARSLGRSVDVARAAGDPRMLAVALGSLAFALQRNDKLDEAERAHAEALALAESAGDAGHVATTRLNLAVVAQARGDIGATIAHLEAAVDMGRRAGRLHTVRQALLNLANLDLYLGRQARAQAAVDQLAAERGSLSAASQAQLASLEADCAALAGDLATAQAKCDECAAAYEKLGRSVDAAEALLERVLFAVRGAKADPEPLQEQLFRAEALLSDSGAHRPLLLLARGEVALLTGEREQAREAFDGAIGAAREAGQREWVWRALEARAQWRTKAGDGGGADRDRKEALAVLEQIASELPRDLREVYWSDPRRRALQAPLRATVLPVTTAIEPALTDAHGPTQLSTGREDRLWRVLEINRQIAGEYDLDRLLERVTDHAIALVGAERGFVLVRSRSGEDRLSIHAARERDGTDPHGRFSRSIAERVVETAEPFVAIDASRDGRVADYVSVHQLMLRSVACVPILRGGRATGALYLETRLRPGQHFRDEIPTLSAFADQVAIAIETARLIGDNRERARELEQANRELEAARQKLEQHLGRRTEQLAHVRRDLRSAREVLRGHFGYKSIVGTSTPMRRVYAVIDRVKDADVPVLITGESGTGKEVIARAIHEAGPRQKGRMVGINCGAIPEQLLESELFGHVRGAFTGADRDRKGLFRELDGGTILLDEIGEMPQKMQAGLLRVLQEKLVRPVGGTHEERVDTRVIAATHRDLASMVRGGAFREDLFYRLNVIEIRVPSLRERLEDVPLLIDHFLRIFAARYGRERRTVSRDALRVLTAYPWPGNVRQLENVLLNAWILSDEAELGPEDFELPDERAAATAPLAPAASHADRPATLDARRDQERERILEALQRCNWNRAKAAQIIGMPRRTFYRRLKDYRIQ